MTLHPELAHALRFLSIDAVQKAQSGHPGMPMGMADIMTVLWIKFLKHNPLNPKWHNRDRFVLSNGHGSMLHYAALHLSGYDLSLDDIKQFRQLQSKTPGHPEYNLTPGIETTTGPLGQGFANAVGMAIAEKSLATQFNRSNHKLIDHHTYVFLGDGCLMEGISHEAASLAGTLGLGKLITFWDDNGISIDGKVASWFSENTVQRFKAYGWHVVPAVNGHNFEEITAAIHAAHNNQDRPTLICCRTQIGFGSPKLAGSHKTHGAPLGNTEIDATRNQLNWPHPAFVVPPAIYKAWNAQKKGQTLESNWHAQLKRYQQDFPELSQELLRRLNGELPTAWVAQSQTMIQKLAQSTESIATRKASQKTLDQLGPILPELLGGSADLSESNATTWQGMQIINRYESKLSFQGNYLHYGVREFGMTAIMNGLALYGGFIPYGGTFLVFSDYARSAIRMAALMKLRIILVLSHDSIGLGEDGPTHQPIEQLSSLRLIPNLTVWRPCDALETAIAWQQSIEHLGPSCLVLSRQSLPQQAHPDNSLDLIAKGAYILWDTPTLPQAILISTGSEVSITIAAAKNLHKKGYAVRVVSMPSMERFSMQNKDYQEYVLPHLVTRRVAIEAGSTAIWHQYVGPEGTIIGLDRYGESAPGAQVFKTLGITEDAIIKTVQNWLN